LNSFWRAIRVISVTLYTLSGTDSQESARGGLSGFASVPGLTAAWDAPRSLSNLVRAS